MLAGIGSRLGAAVEPTDGFAPSEDADRDRKAVDAAAVMLPDQAANLHIGKRVAQTGELTLRLRQTTFAA